MNILPGKKNKHIQFSIHLFIFICFISIIGCHKTKTISEYKKTKSISYHNIKQPIENKIKVHTISYKSFEGRDINCHIFGTGNDTVLITSSIHGDEKAGLYLMQRLYVFLIQNPEYHDGKTIIIIPNANPDGMEKNSRFNSNGVDLNRNFPSYNRISNMTSGSYPLSEPESRMIFKIIETYRPNRIMSIHQPLRCIDYDGPSRELAEYISNYCDLPVRKIGAMPGSLGSFAGENLGIPVITLELDKKSGYMNDAQLWNRYNKMLMAFIHFGEYAK